MSFLFLFGRGLLTDFSSAGNDIHDSVLPHGFYGIVSTFAGTLIVVDCWWGEGSHVAFLRFLGFWEVGSRGF